MNAIETRTRKTKGRRGRNEGSVHQRKDGSWSAAISLGVVNGKRKRVAVYAKTKREVMDKLDKLRQDAGAGLLADKTRMTIDQVLTDWLAEVETTLEKGTARNYQKSAAYIRSRLGGLNVAKLTPANVAAFYTSLLADGKSAYLVRRVGIALGIMLSFAQRRGIVARNVARDAKRPRVERKELQIPTTDEVRRLLAAVAGDRLEALFVVAAMSGARQGELLALQWQDIDFAKGTMAIVRALGEVNGEFDIKNTKTAAGKRVVALPADALDALQRHRKAQLAEGIFPGPTQTVFCSCVGGYVGKANLWSRHIRPALKRADMKCTFHALRHWHASQLLSQGVPLPVVSQRLGHSNRALTLAVYSHALPGGQDQAVSVMSGVLSGENGCKSAVNQ